MSRRALLTALAVLPILAACERKPMLGQEEPAMDPKGLQKAMEPVAARAAPALLGVAAEDLGTRQIWAFNGDHPFALGAAARVPILAAVMAEREAGRLDPNETLQARDVDLSPPPSAIADAWPGRAAYAVKELEALARAGDNTALDLLTKRIGGPGAVNGWLGVKQLAGISVDLYRRQAETEAAGLASFRADWRGQTAWRQALASVPADRVGPTSSNVSNSRRANDVIIQSSGESVTDGSVANNCVAKSDQRRVATPTTVPGKSHIVAAVGAGVGASADTAASVSAPCASAAAARASSVSGCPGAARPTAFSASRRSTPSSGAASAPTAMAALDASRAGL